MEELLKPHLLITFLILFKGIIASSWGVAQSGIQKFAHTALPPTNHKLCTEGGIDHYCKLLLW